MVVLGGQQAGHVRVPNLVSRLRLHVHRHVSCVHGDYSGRCLPLATLTRPSPPSDGGGGF